MSFFLFPVRYRVKTSPSLTSISLKVISLLEGQQEDMFDLAVLVFSLWGFPSAITFLNAVGMEVDIPWFNGGWEVLTTQRDVVEMEVTALILMGFRHAMQIILRK